MFYKYLLYFNLFSGLSSSFIMSENESPKVKDGEESETCEEFFDSSHLLKYETLSYIAPPESRFARLSLYKKFDPVLKSGVECQRVSEDETVPEKCETTATEEGEKGGMQMDVPEFLNKDPEKDFSPLPSLEKTLMTFESPNVEDVSTAEEEEKSCKLFTEKEVLDIVKIRELVIQEEVLKKTKQLEMSFLKKQKEFEDKIDHQKRRIASLGALLKNITNLCLSPEAKNLLEEEPIEDEELKDLDASVEDKQDLEITISDFSCIVPDFNGMTQCVKPSE